MKTVYLVTQPLRMYTNEGYFTERLQQSRDIHQHELARAFPIGQELKAYFTMKSAEEAVKKSRITISVRDDLAPKGLGSRSIETPVIFTVALKDDLEILLDETVRTINRDLIDTTQDAKVSHIENGFKGWIPQRLDLSEIDQRSSLGFFRALNPMSKNSGIIYSTPGRDNNYYYAARGKEMVDCTVTESIQKAFAQNLDLLSGLKAAFDIVMGNHYDLDLIGRENAEGGAKGVLDYFILPLIARKLVADTQLEERFESYLTNLSAWVVAIPIELARFTVGTALTLILIPVVALVHLIRACIPEEKSEQSADFGLLAFN